MWGYLPVSISVQRKSSGHISRACLVYSTSASIGHNTHLLLGSPFMESSCQNGTWQCSSHTWANSLLKAIIASCCNVCGFCAQATQMTSTVSMHMMHLVLQETVSLDAVSVFLPLVAEGGTQRDQSWVPIKTHQYCQINSQIRSASEYMAMMLTDIRLILTPSISQACF